MANCRENETAARVGGEEMSIIAYDCTKEAAYTLAERIRLAIEESECSWQSARIKLTASFGIAVVDESSETAWQVYQGADEALYQAKKTGRNRVCIYEAI